MKVKLLKYETSKDFDDADDNYSQEIIRLITKNISDWEEVDQDKLGLLRDFVQRYNYNKDNKNTKYMIVYEGDCIIQQCIDDQIKFAQKQEDEYKRREIKYQKEKELKKKQREAKKLEKMLKNVENNKVLMEKLKEKITTNENKS